MNKYYWQYNTNVNTKQYYSQYNSVINTPVNTILLPDTTFPDGPLAVNTTVHTILLSLQYYSQYNYPDNTSITTILQPIKHYNKSNSDTISPAGPLADPLLPAPHKHSSHRWNFLEITILSFMIIFNRGHKTKHNAIANAAKSTSLRLPRCQKLSCQDLSF